MSILKGHEFTSNHHFKGLGLANEASETSGPAGSCQHTEVDFRKTNLARVLSCDADVSSHGDFKAATDGVTVDGTDDEFRRLFQSGEGFVGVKAEIVLETGCDAVEHLNGSTCREEGSPVAGQNDARHVIIKSSSNDGFVNVSHHGVCVCVGRAVVWALEGGSSRVRCQFNHGNAVLSNAVVDKSVGHGFKFQSIEVAHVFPHPKVCYEESANRT